jgi:enoyl-[acyl-carrier protein] reductase II
VIRTRLCDILKIEHPLIQPGMGPWTSAELVSAVSNAGGLGILGTSGRPLEESRSELERITRLTNRPYGVNWTLANYPEGSIELAREFAVPVVSSALGDPGSMVKTAHDFGAIYVHQVHTRRQAIEAKERGVDVIIAQGTEAGGFGDWISTLALVPQVVDAAKPIPVIAAGGIADGRGLAAALVLGAEGASMGTRFLASTEAQIREDWKKAIINSESEDAVKFDSFDELFPPRVKGYETVPRALNTEFIRKYKDRESSRRDAAKVRQEIIPLLAKSAKAIDTLVPFTGQTTGLIREILPAAEIVHRTVTEARAILDQAGRIGR